MSSSYAKILGGNRFSASGVSLKWVKSNTHKRKRERPKVGNNNSQLHIANTTLGGARKPPGPIVIIPVYV